MTRCRRARDEAGGVVGFNPPERVGYVSRTAARAGHFHERSGFQHWGEDWLKSLPHGASPNRGARPRTVQYINMFPTHFDEQDEWI